jgi:hypothetical protein
VERSGPPDTPIATVAVGQYVLEVGSPSGATLLTASTRDEESAKELALALIRGEPAAAEPETTTGEEVEGLVDEASAATAKIERALALGKGFADAKALDPAQLGLEADALLDLLERLDRQGRAKEALRLARAASKLYALLRRWLELLRALRAALEAAEKLGDLRGIGWAKHELGTLQLAGGDRAGAERTLAEARQIRERLGDPSDLAATEHNLAVLARRAPQTPQIETGSASGSRGSRALRFGPALALGVVVFCAGVAGGAAIGGGSSAGKEAATVTSPAGTETETSAVDGGAQTTTETSTETVTETVTETATVTETETVTVAAPPTPAAPSGPVVK